MHPAPSVILFTVLSGAGFGFLAFLGAGLVGASGWAAFGLWFLGYALAVGGLLASVFHLGNPRRATRAFSQWRTSWLSREAWASVATLTLLAPVALSDWLGFDWPRSWGLLAAALCLATIGTTSMIYAQLKTVPRWHHWITPVSFAVFALSGGAILSGDGRWAAAMLVALGFVLPALWQIGDGRFAAAGVGIGSATGLGAIGKVTVFEQPHTAPNYLMREMIYVVGRKHVLRLRVLAYGLAVLAPLLVVLVLPGGAARVALAALLHLTGALAARWLFFAQAEHVVGLYYGQR
ncbi:dimethyl sulfoxide reductase anchor subunit family protein [Phaeovulum sp.]|uniref:dimethyl sulfoxide reductase anchor subunit family protein n=1 Tax=Phaeovulum sp. TaxID=2934796 RepID=UPI003564BB7F